MSDAATDCFPVTDLFTQLAGRDDVTLIQADAVGGDSIGWHDVVRRVGGERTGGDDVHRQHQVDTTPHA